MTAPLTTFKVHTTTANGPHVFTVKAPSPQAAGEAVREHCTENNIKIIRMKKIKVVRS